MRIRARRSKSVENIARRLERVARGHVADLTVEQMAPLIARAMKKDLKPHRRTGAAEAVCAATPGRGTITLQNTAYVKYIKGVIWGRRVPTGWVMRLKARLGKNARAAVRGLR